MSEIKLTRKEQAEETKKLLFETALQMLDEMPFEKVNIREIVKRANVSIGTFYKYYATKLDVYYETYIIADDYFETTVKEEVAALANTKEKLFLFFNRYARYSCEVTNLSLTRILYNSANKCFDRTSDRGMMPLLKSILAEGVDNHTFKFNKTIEDMAQFLMISVRGQVYHWCTNDGSYDLIEAVREHTQLLMNIIENK